MKTATILAVSAVAIGALAQDPSGIDTLSECGRFCVQSMVDKAESLGCGAAQDTAACECNNPDFLYGIRDCSIESCTDAQDAVEAQAWGSRYCEGKGVSVTSIDSIIVASPTDSTSMNVIMTSTFTSVLSSGESLTTSTGTTTFSPTSTATETVVPTTTTSTQRPGQTDEGTPDNSDPAARATTAPLAMLALAGVAAFLL